MSSTELVTKKNESRDDINFIPIILFSLILTILLTKKVDGVPPQPRVLFENETTICFQQEDIGTWCTDKTIKDTWDRR